MSEKKLTMREKIEREQRKLEGLLTKRDELNKRIRKTELIISNYRLMENDQKMSAMNDLAESAGISVEDIMTALQGGELLTLQKKIEAAKESGTDPEDEAEKSG